MKLKINRVLFQGVEYEVCRSYDHDTQPCDICGLRWYCEKVRVKSVQNGTDQMRRLCYHMTGEKKFLRKTGQENNGRGQNT